LTNVIKLYNGDVYSFGRYSYCIYITHFNISAGAITVAYPIPLIPPAINPLFELLSFVHSFKYA